MRAATSPRGRIRTKLAAVVLVATIGIVAVSISAAAAGDETPDPLFAEPTSPVGQQEPSPPPSLDPSTPPTTTAPPTIPRPVVVLYGDSLAWEAQDHFVAAFAGHPEVDVITRTFGGTAICDWLDSMRADAAALVPGAVVVEFSGNALTPCMQDATGQPLSREAYLEKYETDAEAVVDIFEPIGAHVSFVGAPTPRSAAGQSDFNGGRLNAMYEQVAGSHTGTASYVDAGAAVLADGRWTATLPCLPGEPCEGGVDTSGTPVNLVRAPDGNHFCPAGDEAKAGVTGACPVWSSGAFRFGVAMAQPLIDALAA